MTEKYGAIWISVEEDAASEVVFERHDEARGLVFVIYKRSDGGFTPYYYKQSNDPQWRLPIWTKQNEKSIFFSYDEARQYLGESIGCRI